MTATATEVHEVPTPRGAARLHVDRPRRSWATLVLGHGAGGGVAAPDLRALADRLPVHGVTVVRVEQPWRVAGRRVAGPPAQLDEAWLASQVAWPSPSGEVLVVGGRSAGARVACRTARQVGAVAVVALAFPLHPPGRTGVSRAAELETQRPTLVVQGTRDAFGDPSALPPAPGRRVVAVPGADHSFGVGRTAPLTPVEALELVTDAVVRFMGELR